MGKFDYKAAEKGIREYEKWIDECEKLGLQIIKIIGEDKWLCKNGEVFEIRKNSSVYSGDIRKGTVLYSWKMDGTIIKSMKRPIHDSHLYNVYLKTLNK